MTAPLKNRPQIEAFVDLVRRYLDLIESPQNLTPEQFVAQAHALLAALYASALALPDVEPASSQVSDAPTPSAFDQISAHLGGDVLYHTVSDPIYDAEMVIGTLADDLSDTYGDLKGALDEWTAGRHADAVWSWCFAMRYHAGIHIVNALAALHRIVFDHGIPSLPIDQRGGR